MTKQTKDRIAETTRDSYSYDRYAPGEWAKAVAGLGRRGYTEEQVIWILMSKIPRWAADAEGKAYGHATAAGILAYEKDTRNHRMILRGLRDEAGLA